MFTKLNFEYGYESEVFNKVEGRSQYWKDPGKWIITAAYVFILNLHTISVLGPSLLC